MDTRIALYVSPSVRRNTLLYCGLRGLPPANDMPGVQTPENSYPRVVLDKRHFRVTIDFLSSLWTRGNHNWNLTGIHFLYRQLIALQIDS